MVMQYKLVCRDLSILCVSSPLYILHPYLCVQNDKKSFLAPSLRAQEMDPEIWGFYFSDFLACTLHLESSEGISQRILHAFFIQLHQEKTLLERVAQLHVYMNVYHLELAKMATVLRPLDQIQRVSHLVPNALTPQVVSPTKKLLEVVQQTQHPLGTPEHLSAFVVNHLFNALVGAAFGQKLPTSPQLVSHPEKMLTWYKAYRYEYNTHVKRNLFGIILV